jgi:xanthine dehydrogenase small subunit
MKHQAAISFVQDDEIKTIDFRNSKLDPTTTVLNYLRNSATHKGTKEGCAEGDCGACTVVIGELNHENKIKYTAIDSCLAFLPMLHGKQLITVENLSSKENKEEVLHPVQKSMVEKNGSQCGYCTPGFIMSMFALYKNENNPSKESIEDALTGNLCRCTGYKPIVEAASHACIHKGMDHFSGKEKSVEKLLSEIQKQDHHIHIKSGRQTYFKPFTLTEALRLKSENPDSLLINGSTDIALRVTKKHELLPSVIDLSSVPELKMFERNADEFTIGAGLNLEEIRTRTENVLPALFDMLSVFGSRQIRSLATLGGNIGSASPIGDTIPVLMAYNAVVRLQNAKKERAFNINEFITGYRQTKRSADEIIISLTIPVTGNDSIVKSYKVSKRKDLDISTVNGGFMLKLKDERVEVITLAYGGMAAVSKRAIAAEEFLRGKMWKREIVERACEIIYNEFTPISDARSGAEFRKVAAKNLLLKFWSETMNGGNKHA